MVSKENVKENIEAFKKERQKKWREWAKPRYPRAYEMFRKLPLAKRKIFFESMSTRSFNDNPKAIYEELVRRNLRYKLVWGLKDKTTDIGKGGIVVPYPSFRYYYHMATAHWIVSNMNQYQVVKRPGQIMVQTMHGIPLKHMGLKIAKRPERIAEQKRLSQEYWDYFVTPCDYLSDIVRGDSYLFRGTLIEAGYPRNDVLVNNADNAQLRDRVRKSLGIPEGKRMILYAPTWRTKKSFNLKLDLKRCKEALGDDAVIVLRAHYLESRHVKKKVYNDFVINGHTYANVNDMLLAADMLITDYSSMMFDYALLKRPIILYTWDYERYVNKSRGTYFDLKTDYPDLIAMTTEEVIEKAQHPEQLMDAVTAMNARFCQYDTGHAAATVVDTLWS